MNTQPTKTVPVTARPVHAKIMRSAMLWVLLAFVVVAAVAVTITTRAQRAELDLIQRVLLSQGEGRLQNLLEPTLLDMAAIANSEVAQSYALQTASVNLTDEVEQLRAQSGLLGQLSGLVEAERGEVLTARYITRVGSVQPEVTWDSGRVAVNTELQLRLLPPDSAPQVRTGLLTELGAIAIADVNVETLPNGNVRPVMSLVTPITRPTDLNSVLGVIEVRLDASRLFTSLSGTVAGMENAADHRLLIVTNAGDVLLDTNNADLSHLTQADRPPLDLEILAFLDDNPGNLELRRVATFNRPSLISATRIFNADTGETGAWRLVAITDTTPVLFLTLRSVVVAVGLASLAAALIYWALRRSISQNLRPLDAVEALIGQLAEHGSPDGDPLPPRTSSPDDSEQMFDAARSIAERIANLNEQIDGQTERYNRNVKVAARIGRETALLENLDDLLNQSIELICTSFGLYHAQVFLVDDAGLEAVLRYSRGEAGRKLLERGHSLPVGSKSVIGRVTATRRAVIVNDTQGGEASGTHAFNPILSDTRAEMAIPLQIGDQILGALDLQSDEPNAFRKDDQQTYQLIADQIAIAIYKTRLLRQSDERIEQIETLNRQLTQMAWEELEQEIGLERSYRYNLLEVERGDIEDSQELSRAGILTAIPIAIRGETIGTIYAAPPDGIEFTDGDRSILNSVSERVALAVENARLFQETQSNLAETSMLYQTSRYLNEADDIQEIIVAIIQHAIIGAAAGIVGIFDEYEPEDGPASMELVASWISPDHSTTVPGDYLPGIRLRLPDHPLLQSLNAGQILLVEDTAHDTRIDPELSHLFEQIQAGAVVFMPLTVRALWRGVVIITFAQPRQFSKREGRSFNNLIDQVGVAVENRLLLQQTELAVSRNERLYVGSRIINQSQGVVDLVRAGVVTSGETTLNFGLALFEGDIDRTGWSRSLQHVAQSRNGGIYEPNRIYDIRISENSPLRNRETEVITRQNADTDALRDLLLEIFQANGDNYGTVFPLFSANQPIALFFVTRKDEMVLSESEHEIYRALTGQMSTVIQNRRLLEQTASALSETRRLYDASRAITDALDLETMYESVVLHLSMPSPRLLRMNVMVAGPDPSTSAPYMDVHHSWSRNETLAAPLASGTRYDQDAAPFGRITQERGTEIMHLRDPDADLSNYPSLRAFFETGNTQNVVITALASRQNWLGVLTLESDQDGAFSDAYIRFVDAVADQIAIALENQLLFEQAQQEARQALALAEASQFANQVGGEFTESINTLFTRVAETAGYDRWLLMLVEGPSLTLVTQHIPDGMPMLVSGDLNLSTADHSIADAVRFNRTLLVNNPLENYPTFDAQQAAQVGKHITTPVIAGEEIIGSLLIGRSLDDVDMSSRDETLISTLAAQVAVSVENRRLFVAAESERSTLRSILGTLPAGVMLLDAITLRPIQHNSQVAEYLGQPINEDQPFSASAYDLYRTGTNLAYPNDELPILVARERGASAFSDDISVIRPDGYQTDLLMNAAPIRDSDGNIVSIVAAFEDISNLRSLENTLQDNLRETISLYEATRTLSEAEELGEVLDVVLFQVIMTEPDDAHIILTGSDKEATRETVRSMSTSLDAKELPDAVLSDKRQLLIRNVAESNLFDDDTRNALAQLGIAAFASVPLLASRQDIPLGWMFIIYNTPHSFSPEEERFLSTLGDNAAVALDNRYLFAQTERALQQANYLYTATTRISRARSMADLSEVIQASLASLSPDVYATYIMRDPSSPDTMDELFNISEDSGQIDFRHLITQFGLFRDEDIYIDDLQNLQAPTPFEQALIDTGVIRAFASVSLRVKNNPDGRIFLAYHQPRTFDDGSSRYLNSLVDGTSIVIDNILLLEQIQTTLEETSLLYQASRSLADATDAQDILDVVVDKLIGDHIHQVFVALLTTRTWDDPIATVDVVTSWQQGGGIDLNGVSLTADQFPAWSKLSSTSVVLIDDVEATDQLNEMERMGVMSLDTRSLTIIPLRVASRSIGAVWIGSRFAYQHTESEQRIYRAFAEQASVSLEASFLLEQTEARARQLATSAQVSQIASSILSLDDLMPRVVDLIKEQFGYDHVQIFLMDAANEYAMLRASTGEPGRELLSIKHKLARGSKSVIGQVTQNGRPEIALDTSDARVIHRPNPYLPLTRSEMALPIIIKGKVIGALDVQSNQPNAFDDDDINVLTTLAGQLSIAIDNARLFNEAELRADEMTFLFTITTAAASAETINEALDDVARLLHDAQKALSVGIYLRREDESKVADGVFPPERDDSEQFVEIVSLVGSQQPLTEIESVRVGDTENLIGIVSAELVPTIINDVRQEPNYLPLVSGARSAVIVPQYTGTDEIIGLIVMESERTYAYDQDTLKLLLALSGTLTAIVQNAQLLDQIIRTYEELKTLDRLKSDFLANMSHELRTPLNSIIGFSRVMLKGIDGPLSDMQEQDLTTIYNSGQHLLGLINDILDSAKIAADKMDLDKSYFDLKAVAEGVRSIGIGLIKEKPVDLRLEVANNLPDAFGDEFRTRQVLLNLISNAAKFTSDGYITMSVYAVEIDSGQRMLRVDVTDTGIGIAEKDLPTLFEAFRQVDSSLTRTVEGTGLGLPIAKSLVELQGGEMAVASEINVGSTFSVTIPIQPVNVILNEDGDVIDTQIIEQPGQNPPEDAPDIVVADGQSTPPNNGARTGKRATLSSPPPGIFQQKRQILLIEDNPEMVDQFRRLLQREGFEVQVANHPMFAETMASGLHPTLIIMDVNFAEGTGWDLLSRLKDRDETFDIPIIVVTIEGDSERAYQLGAYRFIQRPYTPQDLLDAVLKAEQESNVDRILIIDDEKDSTRLIEEVLQSHGKYRVFAAHTGPAGISLVARRRPDLIILDLRMPQMDGFAVLEELRNQPESARIPIVVVTGETTLSENEREQLSDLEIIYKTDLNQENYDFFIDEVKRQIAKYHGDQ